MCICTYITSPCALPVSLTTVQTERFVFSYFKEYLLLQSKAQSPSELVGACLFLVIGGCTLWGRVGGKSGVFLCDELNVWDGI